MLISTESPIEVAPLDFIQMGRETNSRVDQSAVERSWKERGFSCGLWVDPPGQVWTDYVHDTDELVMVVEGDVEFEIDGKVDRPAPGEELFIPARARHTVRNLGRGESRWLFGYRR
jgi:mannose-6-phosphate isomerase-like protein (cupin superfamily)